MSVEKTFLRSLGYLKLPEILKSKFGINSKNKERLKIFPEPEMSVKEEEKTISVTYVWKKTELEAYIRNVRSMEK